MPFAVLPYLNDTNHFKCFCSRSTILVKLNANDKEELKYEPGDHLSIFPSNEAALVDKLIGQLKGAPHPDSPIRIEINNGNGKKG